MVTPALEGELTMPLELDADTLVFRFPEIHPDAELRISFQRTLRVPDDARNHGLPPSLGTMPLRAVDALDPARLPADWKRRGGVALPMWQAEACWLNFLSPKRYPMAVKIAAGKINAVNGAAWTDTLDFADQDYVEVPGQPWLDGFCVAKGVVRQFVAMPLGAGYTAEEQVTGRAEHGGLQILVRPLRADLWRARLAAEAAERARAAAAAAQAAAIRATASLPSDDPFAMPPLGGVGGDGALPFRGPPQAPAPAPVAASMGLAPGGSIAQVIGKAQEAPTAWAAETRSRCFVHIANSLSWRAVTGEAPPTTPPTAADYTKAGLPWFAWYDDSARPVPGSGVLAKLKSVLSMGQAKGEAPLPENTSFAPPEPVRLAPPRPGIRSDF
jgi:hypothetical protein